MFPRMDGAGGLRYIRARIERPNAIFMSNAIPRRHFVKLFVLGSAVTAVSGKPLRQPILAGVTPSQVGHLQVRVSDFPILAQEYGSVRVGVNPIQNPDYPLGDFYPVVITRVGEEFYAVETFCAHAGCIVPPFDESIGAIICPCHGSGYGYDGSLLNGPSSTPLNRYDVEYDGNDVITVKIPNLGYCVSGALAVGANSPRFKLDFPTFSNVAYEVRFREQVNSAGTVVPFALALNGAADQTSLSNEFGGPATVFVDRNTATGFYTVDMKVLDLTDG